jgi:hypothetical protein
MFYYLLKAYLILTLSENTLTMSFRRTLLKIFLLTKGKHLDNLFISMPSLRYMGIYPIQINPWKIVNDFRLKYWLIPANIYIFLAIDPLCL